MFSAGCPLFLQLRMVIKAMYAFKRSAMKSMTQHTKASILWIILLQTRHFAAGEGTLLAEFKTMLEKMVAKDTTITHAEVPAALVVTTPLTPTKPKRDRDFTPVTPDDDDGSERRKARKRETKVHPLLQKHFPDNVLRKAPGVSLKQICKFCNTLVLQVCRDDKRCVLAMLSMCKNSWCTRDHTPATDAEAKHIKALLEKAIKNPGDIKVEG